MVILFYRLADAAADDRNQFGMELNKIDVVDWIAQKNGGDSTDVVKRAFHNDLLVDKRKARQSDSPCSCPSKSQPVDFGAGSYPRHHTSFVCDHENMADNRNYCNSGRCKEVLHKIYILRSRPTDKLVAQDTHILPSTIKNKFYLDIKVS